MMATINVIDLIVLAAVIVLLIIVYIAERRAAWKREKDLMDRLMSRDFSEYVDGKKKLAATGKAPSAAEIADELEARAEIGEYGVYPVDT
jgi:hypothetical protein